MIAGDVMKSEWESMTIEDLLALREQMQDVLSAKLKAKKVELERRLRVLNQQSSGAEAPKHRSPRAVC